MKSYAGSGRRPENLAERTKPNIAVAICMNLYEPSVTHSRWRTGPRCSSSRSRSIRASARTVGSAESTSERADVCREVAKKIQHESPASR